jgi:intraflagellar transport protein 46
MSENNTKGIESDTDSENDEIDFSKQNFKQSTKEDNNNDINNITNNKENNMNKMFNQSRQNFQKFAQMTKNNKNEQSYSEKTLSKEEENLEESEEENENDNYSNKEMNNFSKNKNKSNNDKIKKVTQEKNSRKKNPLQTEKDDYNQTYSDEDDNEDYENNDNDLSEKEIENFDKNNYTGANANLNNYENRETQKLDFFNIDDFLNLDVNSEVKELLNDMRKFTPNRNILILDTKIKPFIPNYVPSIGEVDAFIKINRPDNKLEELGLDYVDEPAINGIDPSIFSLELAYKLKSKIPDSYKIKNIEEAHKNPKMIQNWIDNLENLHKETSSNFIDYSNKMPDLESLMQVIKIN